MESSLLSLSCAIHQWIGFRENLGFFNLKLVESHGFLHQHIGGFQREFLVIPIAPKTTSRQASRHISTIAFWYHCLMWWKQCHLHHPPVITILKKVWYKLTIPSKTGGKNDISLPTLHHFAPFGKGMNVRCLWLSVAAWWLSNWSPIPGIPGIQGPQRGEPNPSPPKKAPFQEIQPFIGGFSMTKQPKKKHLGDFDGFWGYHHFRKPPYT
jgi:hypothetical protein